MTKGKKLKLLVAAILASGCLAGNSVFATDYTNTVTQTSPALVDGDTITVSGKAGILSCGSGGVVGSDSIPPNSIHVIVTNANNTDYAGLFANGTGNRIVLGDNTTIEVSGTNARAVRAADGSIVLGKETQIIATGTDARGVYAHVSSAPGVNSTIVLGSDADIRVIGTSAAFGIFAEGNGQIKVADNGATGSGLYLEVSRTGTGQLRGVRATNTGSEIDLGNNATVKVIGDNGLGVSANSNGKVYAKAGLDVTTQGDGSQAVVATANGKVYLEGAVIRAVGDNTYALYTQNGLNMQSLIQGSTGVYKIYGDAYVDSSIGQAVIQIDFDSGSYIQGAANISGTGGVIDYTMKNTRWDMTGDSTITSLDMNQGNIYFATDSLYGTLTTLSLSGNGNFYMRTNIADSGAGITPAGDLLVVTGASSGDHEVFVTNQGSVAVDGTERLTLIQTSDGVAEFTTPNVIELGGYQYTLQRDPDNPNDWKLLGSKIYTLPGSDGDGNGGGASNSGDASINLFHGSYLLNYAENQTLMKRLGDLRNTSDNKQGNVWARGMGGKFNSSGDGFLRGFDMDYWGIQAGWDKKISRADQKGEVYVGGMFGYSKGSLDYATGYGSIDSKSLGAYWTHISPNGFYADVIFKYGWMNNEFRVLDSAGTLVRAKEIDTHGFSTSLEVGRRYHFDQQGKQGFYIEPQAQLTMGHQSGDAFTASNGLQVKVDSYRSVLGRMGAHIGYEVKGGNNPVNVYVKMDWIKEFDGDIGYSFNGSREATSYKGSWRAWGVGATAQFGSKHNLYVELERASGGQFRQSWAVSGGYRFAW